MTEVKEKKEKVKYPQKEQSEINRRIGERIHELRVGNGLTLKQFGEFTGINYVTLSNYERGFRQITIDSLVKIADLFNVSIEYLITGGGQYFDTADLICLVADEVDTFLKEKNIEVKCSDPHEEEERLQSIRLGNTVVLYGSEYFELEDRIKQTLFETYHAKVKKAEEPKEESSENKEEENG